MRTIIIIIFSMVFSVALDAQIIRKPWSELDSAERSDFIIAIKAISSTDVENLADEHDELFRDGIHDEDEFLPWHRIFIGFFEELVQEQDTEVTLPYWDWYEYSVWRDTTAGLFDDSSGGSTGLFGYNIIETGSPWSYTRNFTWNSGEWGPETADDNENSVTDFSNDLEGGTDNGPHNNGHQFIGGTMASRTSPGDPIFYLHHCMVDKVWADWFRIHNNSTGFGLNTSMRTFYCYDSDCNSRTVVDATHWVNPRDHKLWYAHDGVLLLDLYETSGTEVYKYTTGRIEAEDFIVKSSSDVEFRTDGEPVYLNHNFEVELGGEFEIIID